MKPKSISRTLLITSGTVLLLTTGCQQDSETPIPTVTGTITGYSVANDENGAQLAKDGTTVTVDNLTPQLTATTDANGKFEFNNVPVGTYNLTFTRTGLGTVRRLAVPQLGGPDPTFLANTTLAQPSSTTVTALASTGLTTAGNIALQTTATNPTTSNQLRVALFVGSAADVSPATGTLLGIYTLNGTGPQTINLTANSIRSAGFASGAPVYAVGYGAPVVSPNYVDPSTGRIVYTSLNATASPAITFTAP